MSFKTILVNLNSESDADIAMPVALQLARQFDAHLIGLYVVQNMEIYASVSMQLTGAALAQIRDSQQAQAARVQTAFERHVSGESVVSEWRQDDSSVAASGERVAELARCADLVISAQVDPEHDSPALASAQRRIIEHSGRPVLVIPRAGRHDTLGRNALVGWSGTSEASRAVHDALPLLQQGQETRVFWVDGNHSAVDGLLEQSAHDLAASLDRHGVRTVVSHRPKGPLSVGDELLNEAADTGADLIVTGAYGHSRLYDFVIGATTTHLLAHMTIPVLFSR